MGRGRSGRGRGNQKLSDNRHQRGYPGQRAVCRNPAHRRLRLAPVRRQHHKPNAQTAHTVPGAPKSPQQPETANTSIPAGKPQNGKFLEKGQKRRKRQNRPNPPKPPFSQIQRKSHFSGNPTFSKNFQKFTICRFQPKSQLSPISAKRPAPHIFSDLHETPGFMISDHFGRTGEFSPFPPKGPLHTFSAISTKLPVFSIPTISAGQATFPDFRQTARSTHFQRSSPKPRFSDFRPFRENQRVFRVYAKLHAPWQIARNHRPRDFCASGPDPLLFTESPKPGHNASRHRNGLQQIPIRGRALWGTAPKKTPGIPAGSTKRQIHGALNAMSHTTPSCRVHWSARDHKFVGADPAKALTGIQQLVDDARAELAHRRLIRDDCEIKHPASTRRPQHRSREPEKQQTM